MEYKLFNVYCTVHVCERVESVNTMRHFCSLSLSLSLLPFFFFFAAFECYCAFAVVVLDSIFGISQLVTLLFFPTNAEQFSRLAWIDDSFTWIWPWTIRIYFFPVGVQFSSCDSVMVAHMRWKFDCAGCRVYYSVFCTMVNQFESKACINFISRFIVSIWNWIFRDIFS